MIIYLTKTEIRRTLVSMNIIDIQKHYVSEDSCAAAVEKLRWPDGVRCPICGEIRISRFKSKGKTGKVRRLLQCLEKTCRYQFTATTGTIFHDSHLPLHKWFLAITLVCNAKKGLSAKQMQRDLGVSYKTAWYLCHRIRNAMQRSSGGPKLQGIVEVDETYVGGKYDRRRKRNPHEKQPVIGLIERGGMVDAHTIPTPSKTVLTGVVRARVSTKAEMVVTDQYRAYKSLGKDYRHKSINHLREYVRGNVHTNSIENFWSLFKRGLIGSFHKMSTKHMHRYVNEFTYRFNGRKNPNIWGDTLRNLLGGTAMPYRDLVS